MFALEQRPMNEKANRFDNISREIHFLSLDVSLMLLVNATVDVYTIIFFALAFVEQREQTEMQNTKLFLHNPSLISATILDFVETNDQPANLTMKWRQSDDDVTIFFCSLCQFEKKSAAIYQPLCLHICHALLLSCNSSIPLRRTLISKVEKLTNWISSFWYIRKTMANISR